MDEYLVTMRDAHRSEHGVSQLDPVSKQPLSSGSKARDVTTERYFDHSDAHRVSTDAIITRSLKKQYPQLELVVVPGVDLLNFAASGHATATPLEDDSALPSSMQWTVYMPPARRIDGSNGALGTAVVFAKFMYKWDDTEFLVYLIDGRDGVEAYPRVRNYYILAADRHKADALVMAAGSWGADLHNEVWVFDGGRWMKSRELWQSAHNASWDAVILDEKMKKALIDDHLTFFESRETYANLKVPWKRGLIYHGPPGNGEWPRHCTDYELYD